MPEGKEREDIISAANAAYDASVKRSESQFSKRGGLLSSSSRSYTPEALQQAAE